MRYQQRIYIQNNNKAIRNKNTLNINTSSDICVFETPIFTLSGASKIDCSSGATIDSYIISNDETIPLLFNFTGNTNTFITNNPTFGFEVYKYSNITNEFVSTPIYKSEVISYPSFSATNTTILEIPTNQLNLDGEYIIKPSFQFDLCTDFLGRLNKKIDTSNYVGGSIYGIYNNDTDYYFIALRQAEIPLFINNSSNSTPSNSLIQKVFEIEIGQTTFIIPDFVTGDFIFTFNGSVLAKDLDYTLSGQVVTIFETCVIDDVVTVIYTNDSSGNFFGDTYNITTPIVSGTTDNQGNNSTYFNTTTGKYEVYTSLPVSFGDTIVVMLNGATLANGIDYYQSSSNAKRIILNGNLLVTDVITLVYFPLINVANGLNTNNPLITWKITNPPTQNNGYFSLEVAYDENFSSYYYSGITNYITNETYYSDSFIASGSVGTKLYYRVKNSKNYNTICGDIINTVNYSEIIPITIQTNSINTY